MLGNGRTRRPWVRLFALALAISTCYQYRCCDFRQGG